MELFRERVRGNRLKSGLQRARRIAELDPQCNELPQCFEKAVALALLFREEPVLIEAGKQLAAVQADCACKVRGAVRLSGLSHGGLREVDLDIVPGERLGVVATDPAHAADLLRCLSRQTDPEAGTVELDGVPLRDLDPAELRTSLLVAEHDADLFEGTVRENVMATALHSHDAEPAMTAAGVAQVAQTLPDGEDTAVSERGRSLSGGQRQRVALARALAADRPVLVVHDPTTAVDAVTEARIAAGLREIRKGRTTVLVTTSPALLAVTDRVVLLDDGRIADSAPHTDLVRRHEAYRAAVLS